MACQIQVGKRDQAHNKTSARKGDDDAADHGMSSWGNGKGGGGKPEKRGDLALGPGISCMNEEIREQTQAKGNQ